MNCKRTINCSRQRTVILLVLFSSALYFMFPPSLLQAAPGDVHPINGTLTVSNLPAGAESYIFLEAQDENDLYPFTYMDIDAGTQYSLAVFEGTYKVDCTVYFRLSPTSSWKNFYYLIDPSLSVTGATQLDITIPLVELSGVISDSAGSPVSGAYINVSGNNIYDYFFTGTDGIYQFFVIPGIYTLTVSQSSYQQYTDTALAVTSNTVENISLADAVVPVTYSLSGAVTVNNLPTDFTSSITVYTSGTQYASAQVFNGQYSLTIPEGTYSIRAYVTLNPPNGGYIRFYTDNIVTGLSVTGDTQQNITIPTVLLDGTVTSGPGGPLPGTIKLSIFNDPYNSYVNSSATDGSYRFVMLEGSYSFLVDPPDPYPSFYETIVVTGNLTQDIALDPTQTISGTISFSNLPAGFSSSIRIYADDVASVYPETSVLALTDGQYTLPVYQGTYNVYCRVTLNGPDSTTVAFNYTMDQNLDVTGATSLNVTIPTVLLSGTARDSGGIAVPGTDIHVNSGVVSGDTYSSDGSYQFPVLAGTYTVNVYPPSAYQSFQTTVGVTGNVTEDFSLVPIRTLSGTVTFSNLPSDFLSDIRIQLIPSYQDQWVDANNQYSFSVNDSTYSIDFQAINFSTPEGFYLDIYYYNPTDVIVTGDTVQDLTIPTLLLSGMVKDLTGAPVQGVEFYSDYYDTKHDVTGAEGSYRMLLLPDIYYQDLIVRPPPSLHPPFYLDVDLSANLTKDLQFGLLAIDHGTPVISATAGLGGTITPAGDIEVISGNDITFTITPDTNYYIADVLVDNDSVGPVISYTFINVTGPHSISANFAASLAPNAPQATDANEYVNGNKIVAATGTTTLPVSTSAFNDPNNDGHAETHWRVRRADIPYAGYDQDPADLTSHTFTGLEPGLRYIWQVQYQDSSGDMSPWSDEYGFLVGIEETDTSNSAPAGTGLADYTMISFTHWPLDPSCDSVLGDDMGGSYDPRFFRFGTYDGNSGTYKEFGSSLEIVPGRAYWILARNGLNNVSVDGVPVSLTQDIEVPLDYNAGLSYGWNMVGPPNQADYYWAKVQVVEYDGNGNELGVYNLDDLSIPIDTRLWRWENGSYISEDLIDDPIMWQNEGYWVKALKPNVSLRFPADPLARVVQAGPISPVRMIVSTFYKGMHHLKQLLDTPRAVADGGDSPPLPMGSFDSPSTAGGGCFIATAAYGSYLEPHVMTLRQFRDSFLLTNKPGTGFVETYYRYSPPIAEYISKYDILRSVVRIGLAPLVGFSYLAIHYGMMAALAVLFGVLSLFMGAIIFTIKTREANY